MVVRALGQPDLVEQLGRRGLVPRFAGMPAAVIGAITFSVASRLGTRLNAWKTTPTPWRRCSVSALPGQARDRAAAVGDRPRRRREDAGERGQQRRLPATRWTEQDHERAVGRVEVELVERAHDVVARGVLDREVGDDEIGCSSRPSERERRLDLHRTAQAGEAGEQADDDRDREAAAGTRSSGSRPAAGRTVRSGSR